MTFVECQGQELRLIREVFVVDNCSIHRRKDEERRSVVPIENLRIGISVF